MKHFKKSLFVLLGCLLIISLLLAVSSSAQKDRWWEKLGKPKYGGTLTLRAAADRWGWDQYSMGGDGLWLDAMGGFDRTAPPDHCDFTTGYFPADVYDGQVVESWESPDFATFTFKIHEGIHWHDKPPVNGRELTAYDVEYSYSRMIGFGDFDKPCPTLAKTGWVNLESIKATDKYTVVIKFSVPSVQNLLTVFEQFQPNWIMAPPEAVKEWGTVLNDWEKAIGTGPFLVKDVVRGSSQTYAKNPNYWGYDERWPENKVPYVDELRMLVIPDKATALAALRAKRIDAIATIGGNDNNLSWEQSQALKKSNPELVQAEVVSGAVMGLQLRVDHEPFTDIRVRKALQMSVDLPTIAKNYYHGVPWYPYGPAGPKVKEVATTFEDWPKEVQEGYAYNPEGAKKLLSEAGYPDGFKTNCYVNTARDTQLLQIVKAYLMEIGVDMEIRTLDPAAERPFLAGMKHDQMAFTDMGIGENIPLIRVVGKLYSGYVNNQTGLKDPVYDKMYDDWLKATTWEESTRLAKEINMFVIKGHYRVALMPYRNYYAWQPRFKGYSAEGSNQSAYHIPYLWVED